MVQVTMTMSRYSPLVALSAFALSIADGTVVPRPTASRTAAAQRMVELPRNRLPEGHAADHAAGRADDIINTAGGGGLSASSSSKADDIIYPSPIHPDPRHLVIEGTDPEPAEEGGRLQSKFHEKLSTLYSGEIPSSSLEFSLRNHRSDGRFAIISGLGLNIRQIVEGADESSAPTAPTPCRVKIFTKLNVADTSNIEMNTATAEAALYELALDAQVLCAGEGEETLLNSDLFLRNYREVFQEQYSGGEEAHGRRTATDSVDRHVVTTEGGQTNQADIPHDTEDLAEGDIIGEAHNYGPTAEAGGAYGSHGLTEEEGIFPLLLPPEVILSLYVVVMPAEETPDEISFKLLSSTGDAASPTEWITNADEGEGSGADLYTSDATLKVFKGMSITNGFIVNPDESSSPGTKGEGNDVQIHKPTVFNGAVYYDVFNPRHTSLAEYYDALQYSLLPGDPLHGLPGCDKEFSTGYQETVGSYGFMFDVTSNIAPSEDGPAVGDDEDFLKQFKNVEIYGLDLYIINAVNASFEVHVRVETNAEVDGDTTMVFAKKQNTYTSYSHPTGQTLISQNWEMIASGIVEGQGAHVGSPIPADSWHKNIVIPPGETVGFYVTVKDSPDLRYRNTSIPEGNIYKSDGILNIAVGRSWGEYPLQGDGTDVYFSPREFSGNFRYHIHEGLCDSESPSMAPSVITELPTESNAPTQFLEHSYLKTAEEEGMCPLVNTLETTYEDGTGSYGGLFDMLAKTDLTLTGIDLNIDWNTGDSVHLLIYARKGSWFGHQNNADSWPHLLVNTTMHRPPGFHNRSNDGPHIPVSSKRMSAIVPKGAFKPLEMKMSETWSLYICTSMADFRYTLGTSIGKTVAANPELRIMEGAGAADYPPFHGGTPEDGGYEYTFYAPRVFNGNLRYDFVSECPSEPPSSVIPVYSTSAPSITPTLTTMVSYTFYVEHSPDKLKDIAFDMEVGVREVLDRFLGGGEDILYGYKKRNALMIERVVATTVSPMDIGYLCYPTPPQSCTPISVDVSVMHLATATTDEITFALLRQSVHLPKLIDVDGYTMEYVGDRAVETNTGITLTGVPDREMIGVEREFFEEVAREFLAEMTLSPDASGNDSLRILSVTVDGQEITNGVSDAIDEPTDSSSLASMQARNSGGRRLKKSNKVKVSVKGKYRPPPEVNFGELIEDSINQDRELLEKELKERDPPPVQDAALGDALVSNSYFEEAEVVGAQEIVEEKKPNRPLLNHQVEEDSVKKLLNAAAMGVGGAILLLSLVFFLRPHRRRALFSSGYKDKRAYRHTARVDVDDGDRFMDKRLRLSTKNRALIRGESLTDSNTSFPNSDKAAFDLHGSSTSENNLRFSHVSASGASRGERGFDPRASGTSMRSSGNRGQHHPVNGSFISGGPLNASFARPQEMAPGPYDPQGGRNHSTTPRRPHHGPPPGGPGERNPPRNNSMPPMGGGPGRPRGGHINHSMTSQPRGHAGESMRSSFQSGHASGRGSSPPRGVHTAMDGW